MLTLTRAQVREVDRLAIEELGIPGVVLMENAGRNAAHAAAAVATRRRRGPSAACRVVVLCGGGNNGGDGYVIARHLHILGFPVEVVAVVPIAKLTGDAAIHAAVVEKMRLPLRAWDNDAGLGSKGSEPGLVIDALLGTGFRGGGEVREPLAAAIRGCVGFRRRGGVVVAVDLPSGLDADTGAPADPTVEADLTVTFVAAKPGLSRPGAARFVGEAVVVDIGVPPEWVRRATAPADRATPDAGV